MKRYLSMFLIMLLLFPTTSLSVFANTLENTEPIVPEPTAYFPLNEDLEDKTGNNSAGIPWRRFEEGVSEWGEAKGYAFEFHADEGSVYFDGTTGIRLGANLITGNTYSYSIWLKHAPYEEEFNFTSALFTGIGGRRAGISPGISTHGELLYEVDETQATETGLPKDYQFLSLSEIYQPGEWNNVIVSVNQSDLLLYVNGEQVGEIDNVLNIYEDLFTEYLVGFNPFPDPYYQGYINEVMFFDGSALSSEQIEYYYNSVVDDFRPEEDVDEGDIEDPDEDELVDDQDQEPSDEVITNDHVPSLPKKTEIPEYTNVSVHDPSIITADGKFYAFGTHIDSARSDDLINWESFTNGYTTSGNALYGDLSVNLAEAFKWAGEDDSDSKGGFAVWAPEAFFNPDYKWDDGTTGAYMIYYSASSTYIRSVIGFAVAKNIEGPYEHVDTLIYSGFTDHEAYDSDSTVNKHWENTNIKQLVDDGVIDGPRAGWFNNSGGYNNSTFTNAIDANLFYDEDGSLWMTYGSWSGGIFILEVDQETGRVIYPGQDGQTDDGRLIDRYFGTKISGGYTKSGEGPYVEYNPEDDYYYLYVTYGWLGADGGYHMRQFRSENPDGPYVDRAGEPAVLPGNVSNEAYGNKLTGNFLFKRESGDPGTGEGYGYVSPGHNSIYTDQETNQQFNVFHTRFPNRGEVHELRIHQMFTNQDGWRIMAPLRYAGEILDESITSDEVVGSYKYVNHGKNNSEHIVESELIDLHADGTISGSVTGAWERDGYYATLTINGQTYDGVFVEMWDEVSQMWLMTFTALSDQGISVWGIQHPMKAATDEEIVEMVAGSIELPSSTFANLNLPTNGSKGTIVNWRSSNTGVISSTGVVTRPSIGDSEKVVTLTAEITLNDAILIKTFEITVIPYQEPELRAHYRFDGDLSDVTGQFEDAILVGDRPDKTGEGNLIFEAGRFGDALYLDGSSGALLPDDLLVDDHFSIGFWFNPEEIHQFGPSLFVMQDEDNWFSLNPKGWNNDILLWSRVIEPRENWFDGITGRTAQIGEWHHVVITNEYGRIRIYVNGERVAIANNFNQVVNGDALTMTLGVNPFDPAFKGYFDDLVIYQAHTLSNEDVKELYQGQIPDIKETEIVATHFTFDEDLTDVSGNYTNAFVTGDRIDNTDGQIDFRSSGVNKSIYFDGQSGVNLGTGLITSYEYSVSFWLKPEELRDYTTSFFGTHPDTGWTSFLPGGSHQGGVTKLWSGEDWYDANLDFLVELNEWSHISYTVDNGDLRIYVNGKLEFSGVDFPNVFTDDQAIFSLGVNYWDTPYKGYIDELIIHDAYVLSAEDVENYYLETLPLIDQDNDDHTPGELPSIPTFKNVGVHDPSVIVDNGTFYVFGSHLASAKSNDLIQWEQMTTEVSSDNPLFEDVFKELEEVFGWAETDTLWAADVIQLEDGRYYMYYNACRGDSPLSAMGLAVSDSVEGPYEDLGLFLWSGKTPNPMDLEYNIDIHPNAVDPAVFFDHDGQLWMVYGSYSGGIFILEMDNETGLPKEKNSYGKLLTGGGVRIEASYMQYIPETGYYYLYTTFGGLDAVGGYNMRISRSENPDGPFVDISGQDMIDAKGRPGIPFDDEAIEPYGLKLNGNFRFSNLNAVEDYPVYGYVSPGHNSSHYDPDTGEHFSLFHTRFPHRGEEHEVRVHLMPMNKDGWPLMAPHRYAGESVLPVDIEAIPGAYHFVNHGDQISADINNTQYIELNADGSITGEVEGSWKLAGEHYAEIVIDGVTYDGVFLTQWDETEQDFVMTFTAASDQGHSIWGSQFESVSDQEFVDNVLDQLSLGNLNRIYSDIQLPNQAVRGVTLDWTSSDQSIVSNAGVVSRPDLGEGDKTVTLTVALSYNGLSEMKSFEATVIEKAEDVLNDGLVAHYPFNGSIIDRTGNFDTPRVTGDLMTIFEDESELDFSEGAVGQALYLDGTSGLHLGNGLIQNHDYSVAMWLKPEELRQFATAFFGMKNSDSWSSFLPFGHDGTTMLWSGTDWYDASTNMTISENEWTHLAYTVKDGDVTIYLNGEVMYQGENFPDIFTGTNAEFSLGVNLWDQPYQGLIDDLRIYAVSIDKEVIEQLLVASPETDVEVNSIQLATGNRNIVIGTTYQANATVYPINAADRSITWQSDNPTVATVDPTTGVVNALDFGEAIITATANDGSGTEASFVINVTDGKVAHYTFDADLSDSLGISEPGTVTGDRATNTNGQISYSDGINGQALVFDGKSGVRLPDGLISSPTYSVSLWLNPNQITTSTTSFFGARSDTNWVSLVPGGWDENKAMVWSGSQRWYDAVTDFHLPTNAWTHVTYTVDNGTILIYVNGEIAFEGSDFPDIFSTNNAVFSLGVNYWDLPFSGMMDELIVYDGYALSEEEVINYYSDFLSSDEEVKDEIIIEDISTDFTEKTESGGQKVYVAKTPARAYQFKVEAFSDLDEDAQIEVTNNNVHVRIPIEIIRESGQSEVRFDMNNVTDTLADKITAKEKRLSELIRFSLKDQDGKDIAFEAIYLIFEIDLGQIEDIDNLRVIYFNADGVEVTDHGAEIIEITETGAVIVRVSHFSTYGIVEVLADDSDTDGDDSSEDDSGANDQDGEGIENPDGDSDSNEDGGDSGADLDPGEDDQDQSADHDSVPDLGNHDGDSTDGHTDEKMKSDDQQPLPKTATNMYNLIYIGLMLIFMAGSMFFIWKRKLN